MIENNDFKLSKKLNIKLKKIDENRYKSSTILPKIYAKANELNRRLSLSNSIYNDRDLHSSSSIFSTNQQMNDKDRDIYQSACQIRKKSMIVSKYLDEELKMRFEKLKHSGRRPSEQNSVTELNSNSIEYENELNLSNENLNYNYTNSRENSSSLNLRNKSPRFGSTLSKDGQYALMKSLEDTILREIELGYPELKDKVPRTTTAQYRAKSTDKECSSRLISKLATSIRKLNNVKNVENSSESESEKKVKDYSDIIETTLEFKKRQAVTKQIDSALEILDLLRLNNQKFKSKSIQFNSKVNYYETNGEFNAKSNKLAPIRHRLSLAESELEEFEVNSQKNSKKKAKVDPILRYTEWRNSWLYQLENF